MFPFGCAQRIRIHYIVDASPPERPPEPHGIPIEPLLSVVVVIRVKLLARQSASRLEIVGNLAVRALGLDFFFCKPRLLRIEQTLKLDTPGPITPISIRTFGIAMYSSHVVALTNHCLDLRSITTSGLGCDWAAALFAKIRAMFDGLCVLSVSRVNSVLVVAGGPGGGPGGGRGGGIAACCHQPYIFRAGEFELWLCEFFSDETPIIFVTAPTPYMAYEVTRALVQVACFITAAAYLPDPIPLIAAIMVSFASAVVQDRD